MKPAKWFWKKQLELDKEYENADYCRKCNITLDDGETICCTCIDDTIGRNAHFSQIKNEA
tara:strand:- start:1012 stop:1191 length:180 start_codon:yes stop_codon:yes gene_type:complete